MIFTLPIVLLKEKNLTFQNRKSIMAVQKCKILLLQSALKDF